LLVAQAGVPFTSGFIAKFGVIGAAVDESSYTLAIVAMLSTVIAAYLYLRIMVSSWIQEAPADDDTSAVAIPFGSGVAIVAAVGFTLVVGLFPEWLLDVADQTVQFAR
jgi:NADH-quinone oxidoreductase subunit N